MTSIRSRGAGVGAPKLPECVPSALSGTDCGFSKQNRMLKIRISIQGDLTIFLLSGRIEGEYISQLETLISAEKGRVALDLGEVTIAGLAGVRFLARCEQTGIKIQNCPAYIREWISREHGAS